MNQRDREQLRASIAKDLAEGQGEHSATRELLRQYAPLEGIVTDPIASEAVRPRPAPPVEKSMAPRATVARDDSSAWHAATVAPDATIAPHATVAGYAMVKGELRVPNTINFSLFPTLDPFAKTVYYQLFLLSHGFRKDTCLISLSKLARVVLMSQRKVQNTIAYLEKRGLIRRIESKLGGPSKGNLYQVPLPANGMAPDAIVALSDTMARDAAVAPHATMAPRATVARGANIKMMMMIRVKTIIIKRAENSRAVVTLWKTTASRLRRERDRRVPTGISHSFATPTRRPPATSGPNRTPLHTKRTTSRRCQPRRLLPSLVP